MAGDDGREASESSSLDCSMGDGTLDDSCPSSFQCCVCLDLLYKPVVLACGHISCFWCVHKAMHGLGTSHCAICRQPYIHFPSICQLLHHLLMKIEPGAYKRREKEVLEEEKRCDVFSPQFVDYIIPEKVPTEEIKTCAENLKANGNVALTESGLPENGLLDRMCKQISAEDVMCALCKELLFQPSVLNCGHVYCKSCLSSQAGGPLKCPFCEGLHPGEFPNVCLDLDQFLEEQFPREYAMRKEQVQLKIAKCQHGESSSSALQEKQVVKPSSHAKDGHLLVEENLRNVHVGVGCDSCGIYPISGKRYKCKDCTEAIGFDLCEECYNSSSKFPGRFNQQHTPDHKFELDESQLLCRILLSSLPIEVFEQDLPDAFLPGDLHEDHDDLDENNVGE